MSLLILLLALGLLRWGRVPDRWQQYLAALAAGLCFIAGLDFPDLDQWLPIGHRSGLTHSVLVPILLALRVWARPAAAGLALGIGIHLAADTFPEAMIGYATVKLPFAGSIGTGGSYFWLAGNAIVALNLGGVLLQQAIASAGMKLLLILFVLGFGGVYLLRVDGGWWALAAFGLAYGAFAGRRTLPRGRKSVRAPE